MQRTNSGVILGGLTLAGFVVFAAIANACGPALTLEQQARLAISPDPQQAQTAIGALRAAGVVGLEALLKEYGPTIKNHLGLVSGTVVLSARPSLPASSKTNTHEPTADQQPDWPRVKAAIDAVGGQYDCYTSRLFWYTDWEATQAAARQSGKPILELRLLGKLTDEFSCANSRFFRSTLYANEDISQLLRDHFVLYWQSVRPVPKVTIDFGDGRKLERTITGNSIHYILDSEGRPIDALPGVYGPQAFLRGLKQAETAIAAMKPMNDSQRDNYLRQYHEAASKEIIAAWRRDLQQLSILTNDTATTAPEEKLLAMTDDAVWGRIAQLHAADAQLDAASVALIRSQNPSAARAMSLAVSKAVVENPLLRLVRTFQNAVAIDSVRNEYTFHRELHEWFVTGKVSSEMDVNELNESVYAQLFLTPSSDPWLGLLSGYTGLDNNGVCQVP